MEKSENKHFENETELQQRREEVAEEPFFGMENQLRPMNDWKENTFHIIPVLSHFL